MVYLDLNNMEEAKKIIARLIDLKYITGDEALILFEAINKPGEIKIEPVTVPINYPINYPTTPYYKPFEVWCNTNDTTANYNTSK